MVEFIIALFLTGIVVGIGIMYVAKDIKEANEEELEDE